MDSQTVKKKKEEGENSIEDSKVDVLVNWLQEESGGVWRREV